MAEYDANLLSLSNPLTCSPETFSSGLNTTKNKQVDKSYENLVQAMTQKKTKSRSKDKSGGQSATNIRKYLNYGPHAKNRDASVRSGHTDGSRKKLSVSPSRRSTNQEIKRLLG